VSTDVSEEHIASIFRVEKNKFSKKPARICSSEMSVDTQWTIGHYISEVDTLQTLHFIHKTSNTGQNDTEQHRWGQKREGGKTLEK
jgi:hypothetical protein